MWRFVITLVLVLACIGAYRGWFHLSSDKSADKSHITLTVDKDKIHDDTRTADQKTHDIVQHPQK